jgi:deazaflavin-dependent oxidoreductase (nitroreductase family)
MWCADGECYVVAAAAAGAARNPAWYHNLMAHPAVPIEVGNRVLDATARVAIGTGRDRLFNRFAPEPPQLASYQTRTNRQVPMIVLAPAREPDRAEEVGAEH